MKRMKKCMTALFAMTFTFSLAMGGFGLVAAIAEETSVETTVETSVETPMAASRIDLPEINIEAKTYMTLEEAGIDEAAIWAGVPATVELTYTATADGGIISFADIGGAEVDFVSCADWNNVDMTLENGVWSGETTLSQTDFQSNDYFLYIYGENEAWQITYRSGEVSGVIFNEDESQACFSSRGLPYLLYQLDSIQVANFYEGVLSYQTVSIIIDGALVEVEYTHEGDFKQANINIGDWYNYYPETGWENGNAPTGYENADEAYFREIAPCQIHFHDYTEEKYDEVNHWMECVCGEKDSESETAHTPNADDGDCTTEIICSACPAVTTAANETHTGGTATCVAAAVCENCGTSYGEVVAEHQMEEVWLYNASGHYYQCANSGAGCKYTTEAIAHDDDNNDGVCDVCEYVIWEKAVTENSSKEESSDTDTDSAKDEDKKEGVLAFLNCQSSIMSGSVTFAIGGLASVLLRKKRKDETQ